MDQIGQPERRRFRRVALNLPVRVWGTDRGGRSFFADGETEDLSPEGLRFRMGSAPDPSRPLVVYLTPPNELGGPTSYRFRASLAVLRVESVPGTPRPWRVCGRYDPEQSEWLRVEAEGQPG
jgi:hypothetical protein